LRIPVDGGRRFHEGGSLHASACAAVGAWLDAADSVAVGVDVDVEDAEVRDVDVGSD
jgi:hypothetical protein